MNIMDMSPREFSAFLEEERQYRTPEQIDDLMRRYNAANSLSGRLAGLLEPTEGRRRATFFPASVPEGMSLFDAVRSGEAEFAVPQGIVDMVVGGVQGVENPGLAAQGRVPAADMETAALQTAGTAMTGGGFVAAPRGAIRSGFVRTIQEKYPDVEIDVYGSPDRGYELSKIEVPKNKQGSGLGTQVMNDLVAAADAEGARISLTPDTSFGGTSVSRLKDFYKRFGFVDNKGKNKDFSTRNTMYRDPSVMANASKGAGLLSVASDVSARGDQILSMLKSGRGSEVTDAMLDMGDGVKNTQLNQYLAANYDLPMDEASRLARAREMGFEGNLFHGTDADILALDKEKFGLGENLLGKGFYTTGNPKRANIYVPIGNPKLPKGVFQTGNSDFTEGGNILPLMTRSSSEFDARQSTGKANAFNIGKAFEGSDFDVEIKDEGDQVFIKSKTNPDLSVYIDSYQDGMITLQKLKDVFGRENVTNILEEAGFTGLKAPESSGSVTRVNYNPQDVRSQFARFDPRLSHLSNVTAANASPISGLLAQSGVSSEQAQRIEDYLYKTGLLQ
jgi:GNAT superfamily N-acetyltransferase